MNADECTYERKWLVRHLVELRFRLIEVKDFMENKQKITENTKVKYNPGYYKDTEANFKAEKGAKRVIYKTIFYLQEASIKSVKSRSSSILGCS